MKLLIISDTHSPTRKYLDIVEFIQNYNYDLLIHCWDFDKMETYLAIFGIAWKKLVCVHWNSDEDLLKRLLPESKLIEYKTYRIWIVHSNQIYPRWDKQQLVEYALNNGLDVLIYWHTHVKSIIKYYNWIFSYENELADLWSGVVYLVNPWSLLNWDYLYLNI